MGTKYYNQHAHLKSHVQILQSFVYIIQIDPVVDLYPLKIGQVELIEKSSTGRSSQVDFSTSRVDQLVDD